MRLIGRMNGSSVEWLGVHGGWVASPVDAYAWTDTIDLQEYANTLNTSAHSAWIGSRLTAVSRAGAEAEIARKSGDTQSEQDFNFLMVDLIEEKRDERF